MVDSNNANVSELGPIDFKLVLIAAKPIIHIVSAGNLKPF